MPEGFSNRMEQFCREYLIDFNATQAAIRAGYSIDTAYSIGSENLKKPDIIQRLAELRKEIDERNDDLSQKIIDELKKVGFANIQDFINPGNEPKDFTQIDREQASAIAGIKKSVTEFGDDQAGGTKTTVEFKLHDKLTAIEKLGRYVGLFEKDNNQKSPRVIRVIDEEDE